MNLNWMRKWQVWAAIAVAVIVLAAIVIWLVGRGAQPEYRTAKIERGTVTASVSASGTLNPVVSVQVGSQISGQIRDLYADFNSEVKQGQLIARIDPETFEYKVRQSQADVDSARSQLQAQRSELVRQQVNLANAKRDMERKLQLVEKGFLSPAERDNVKAVYDAQAALTQVTASNVRNAESTVKQREAALAQAKVDLDRTAIRAPVNGVVIKRSVERGQTVAASLQAPELFIIAENLEDMQVDTSIDESEIGRIREGQKATFTVDAYPGRVFEGEVRQIRKAAQNVSNVITYLVIIAAPNPNRELLPGMTANARILIDSKSDVLLVPNAALRFRPPASATGGGRKKGDAPSKKGDTSSTENQMQALREKLERELALSDDQKDKLESIFAAERNRSAAARQAPEGERQKLLEQSRNELRAQIGEMLTPEQKPKFEAMAGEFGVRRAAVSGGGTAGRIYIMDEKRRPKAVDVRLGITDGTMTELLSPEMQESVDVIVGAITAEQAKGAGTKPSQPPGPRMF